MKQSLRYIKFARLTPGDRFIESLNKFQTAQGICKPPYVGNGTVPETE